MDVKLEVTQNTLAAYLRGELDHHTAAGLRQTIDDALDKHPARQLVLDFSGVSFMDSSGIGLILGRYKRMQSKGGTLLVEGASARYLQVMKMAGLETLGILKQKGREQDETHQ